MAWNQMVDLFHLLLSKVFGDMQIVVYIDYNKCKPLKYGCNVVGLEDKIQGKA